MRRARLLSALALAVALIGLPALPASAHAGDGLANPIFEQMSPTVPGVNVQVLYSANYELLVTNNTQTDITFFATGPDGKPAEPFLTIGPKGVTANFASPTWYNSNVPEGLQKFPEQAKAGAEVPPIWHKIAAQPSWGWYDHRLHPVERYVPLKIQQSKKTTVLGKWKVPLRYGDKDGELQGRLEYKPPLGSYTTVQKSSQTPAEGVKIQIAPGRTVPAIFVENLSPDPLVVLGKDGEPFARFGPKVTEVNTLSPTWAEIQQAKGVTPDDEADAKAEPKWLEVSNTPRWSWLEFRAAAPKADPPKQIAERSSATTVKTWTVPYLHGDKRDQVEGITQFVPIAELRKQAGQAANGGGGGGSKLPLYGGIGVAVAALAGGLFLLRRRKAGSTPTEPETRHRSRSTPKQKVRTQPKVKEPR